VADEDGSGNALCDICGTGRAPFLRYGTVDRTGRMCPECPRRTLLCARCQQPGTRLVPRRIMDQGTGPGWTEYTCLACTNQVSEGSHP